MNEQIEFFQDDLKTSDWLGEVVDIDDPLRDGRVRVKVFGKFDNIPTEHIPWAKNGLRKSGGSSTGSGDFDLPKLNTIVSVKFDNGNLYQPVFFYSNHPSDELKAEITQDDADYLTAKSLWYDSDETLKMFYTSSKGIFIELNGSILNIRPDNSIYIEYAGGRIFHVTENMISLGQEDESNEQAVLGNTADEVLQKMIDDLGKITGITTPAGPSGSLSTATNWSIISRQIKNSFQKFLSENTSLD